MRNGTRDFSRGSCSIFPMHRCAGPGPVLDGRAQPARNGVFLYVAYDPLFLSPVPYAVLEIVFCPERRPACREQAISLTSTGALNTGDTTRQTFRRPKQQVQVVWHQSPGAQLESPLDLPSVQTRQIGNPTNNLSEHACAAACFGRQCRATRAHLTSPVRFGRSLAKCCEGSGAHVRQ